VGRCPGQAAGRGAGCCPWVRPLAGDQAAVPGAGRWLGLSLVLGVRGCWPASSAHPGRGEPPGNTEIRSPPPHSSIKWIKPEDSIKTKVANVGDSIQGITSVELILRWRE